MYAVDRACTVCESVLRSVEWSAVCIVLQASLAKDSRADRGTTPTAEVDLLDCYTRSSRPLGCPENKMSLPIR